jgi:hypothetical protein
VAEGEEEDDGVDEADEPVDEDAAHHGEGDVARRSG